ncbi:MAG: site-specific DNA-methyltransferase [Bacteroidetes bacterium]|nr:site-specific DNA-methyltransferase [Bacteroidota bacterium]
MPAESVNCCITSPPYWGLRDYGVSGQLGLEKTPEEYVAKLIEAFREVHRVLRNDGTLWLNLGSSYASKPPGNPGAMQSHSRKDDIGGIKIIKECSGHQGVPTGWKEKDLIPTPWMAALALRTDGWYLRQDLIWHKPNPMPESVTDRCTKAHEYIFLLAKSAKYYYDAEAIKEPANGWNDSKFEDGKNIINHPNVGKKRLRPNGAATFEKFGHDTGCGVSETRNRRSVWTVTTKPFSEAHFATFPPDLIKPMVLAGCPEGGIILDPFGGAGTTGMVAKQNYRNFILIDLNPKYTKMADRRIDGTLVNKKLNFTEAI